jgi:hypothetical protein
MRVLVCGGRNYADFDRLKQFLDALPAKPSAVIHGNARGADRMGGVWAKNKRIPVEVFEADWSNGRSGGPVRNQRMIDEGKPDLVVAFPGNTGTADMVRRADAAGIPVVRP